jgi:hypothetical protein
MTMRLLIPLTVGCAILMGCSSRYERSFTLNSGEHDLINAPVYVDLEDSKLYVNGRFCLRTQDDEVPVQVENLDEARQRIWWIANAEAGQTINYELRSNGQCHTGEYTWEQVGKHSRQLTFGGRPVIQYEHPVFDPDDIEGTKKPFHHVFEPSGDQLITKGPGGLYPHHRGIFYGYNHVYINGERIDIWHARNGERSEHIEVIREYAGTVMGGHEVKIHWKDMEGNPFIEEIREVRVFKPQDGETLIDFHSTMTAVKGPVRLEGDRQHAGVQFRASQYVAENRENSKFIRPPALSHLSGTKEIDGDDIYDLPWNAMHFMIDDKPFTVVYMSHPSNPSGAEMSERLYGRFGEFFPYHLTKDNPLVVHYRFLVIEGPEPSPETLDKRYQAYTGPVMVARN